MNRSRLPTVPPIRRQSLDTSKNAGLVTRGAGRAVASGTGSPGRGGDLKCSMFPASLVLNHHPAAERRRTRSPTAVQDQLKEEHLCVDTSGPVFGV